MPIAGRLVDRLVSRCVANEAVELVGLRRPVVPRLLVGRVRDVEVAARGVVVGDLRIEQAHVTLDAVDLPWRLGGARTVDAVVSARVVEGDVQRLVRAVAPLRLPLTVAIDTGVLRLGIVGTSTTLDLEVEPTADGGLRVRPVAGDTALLDRLGLAAVVRPPEDVGLTALTIDDGAVAGTLAVRVTPGAGDGSFCDAA